MKNQKIAGAFLFVTDKFFAKFFASWFTASIVFLISDSVRADTKSTSGVSIGAFAILFVLMFGSLSVAQYLIGKLMIPELALCVSFLAFACLLLTKINSMYVYLPLTVFFFLALRHYFDKKQPDADVPKKLQTAFICIIAIFFAHVVMTVTVLRCKVYAAPNFDFGIFCNMYYNIKNGFLPLVSSERDRILSHFAVHFSPALYIFAPIYIIFPSPITVAVCQTAAIFSGIIPFMLIAKKREISGKPLIFLSVIFAASPVLCGGSMFDFHENCLLVPLLMWTFYFYEKDKTLPMFIFAFLTLLVKEDAFIYIVVFAAYIMIAEKKIKRSIGLIVMSVAYFLFACWMLKTYGLGIMSNRFDSMIGEGESLLGIIKTVLLNPGYSIRQIFTDKDNTPAKLFYFCQLLFPLAFLPFMTKKYARLILILPIFLNLLTNYLYQYDISFQYSFGIGTLLLYLSLINVKDMPDGKKNFTTALSAGLTVMLFFMLIMPKYQSYIRNYDSNKELYARMDYILSEIPEDKSVSASTFLIPNLSKREVLYETFYHKDFDTDLIILDCRSAYADEAREIAAGCEENGYKLEFYEEGCLMIYSAPEK